MTGSKKIKILLMRSLCLFVSIVLLSPEGLYAEEESIPLAGKAFTLGENRWEFTDEASLVVSGDDAGEGVDGTYEQEGQDVHIKVDEYEIEATYDGETLVFKEDDDEDDEKEESPEDLDWLRSEVGDGALIHHANGRIYLTELLTGETVLVGNGDQPEFSPYGTKFAWIDGRTAKGRMRKGDKTVHVIADHVERAGGVHWLSNDEVALVLRTDDSKSKWYRVSLSGDMKEIPKLTVLGRGGYECDVRLGKDGVWSYVADNTWKTSDGKQGRVAGSCSVSLSPDGLSVTSLHDDHKTCSIEAIRPGGIGRILKWKYKGGFDNHRWASNDARFIVVVDECDQDSKDVTYPVIMKADGSRSTRLGNKGYSAHGVYGDFVIGDGLGESWSEAARVREREKVER